MRAVPTLILAVVVAVLPGLMPGCSCDPPPEDGGEGEGEGEGEEGEGEGEGEGEPRPPTEPIRTPDPSNPNNATRDSDCDGLTDAEEFANTFAGGLRTDPADYDSDDDGLADGIELGRDAAIDAECPLTWVDLDTTTTSSPVAADTDADCIPDGAEDKNLNGRRDAGETDPTRADSDGDTIVDGGAAGEDLDCDGVLDAGETNGGLADTDGDGVNDGVERTNGTDPLVPDAVGPPPGTDADSDGLSDDEEADLGTNPNDADSDDDTVNDGDEVERGTDPLRADTDGDGLSDGIEVNSTFTGCATGCVDADPARPGFQTSPLNPDSDADGILDGVEDTNANGTSQATETDPTRGDSDGDGVLDGAEDSNQNGRVDPGELNPLNPADVNATISASCATPITPGLFPSGEADILLALSPDFGAAGVRPIVRNGVEIGSSAFDASRNIFAFAIRRGPAPNATAAAQLTAIESGLGGDLSLPITQQFTTWDGFEAVRGTYNLAGAVPSSTRLTQVARVALGLGQGDTSLALDVAGSTNEAGAVKLGLAVIRRSGQASVIVGVATNLAQFNNPDSGRDFRLEDVSGGTAQGQVGDTIGTQCETVKSVADTPVDFVWVLDNSGSMGDELNAVTQAVSDFSQRLANTELDSRVAVITTEFQFRTSGPTFANDNAVIGNCQFGGTTRVCMCAFTSPAESAQFSDCIGGATGRLNIAALGGSGAEGSYKPIQSAITDVWRNAATTQARRRIRDDARVVSIFISDAGEQSPDNLPRVPYAPASAFVTDNANGASTGRFINETTSTAQAVTFWADFFGNRAGGGWDPTRTNEPAMFVNGILCPLALQATTRNGQPAIGCNGEEDATGPNEPNFASNGVGGRRYAQARYYGVVNELGGIAGSIADNVGEGFQGANLANIGATIEAILRAVVTGASPYQLTKDPIASTIKVAVEGPTVGACNVNDVPRVSNLIRSGFLYDAASNSIAFIGNCRPADNKDIAVSYRTWLERSPNPDGNNDPCGDCPSPFVCLNEQCICPSDCGGLPSPQHTCDRDTCQPECALDCNATCGGFETCNTESCTCECVENATCGPGFVFDSAACGCVCDVGALACSAERDADLDSCRCVCDATCNDSCANGQICDPARCECRDIGG